MNSHTKLLIAYSSLLGRYKGTLEGICHWEIPEELKENLKKVAADLEKINTREYFEALESELRANDKK